MTKIAAFGLILSWDPAGGTTWVAIAQVGDVDGPSLTRNVLTGPAHDDTSRWVDKVKAGKNAGTISFPIFYDPAGATHKASTGLLSDFAEDTVIPNWKITYPDTGATVWTGRGMVASFTPKMPVEGWLTADLTIELTGAPTLA